MVLYECRLTIYTQPRHLSHCYVCQTEESSEELTKVCRHYVSIDKPKQTRTAP